MNSSDRLHLIQRIQSIEGLSDSERSALLGLLRETKSYGLVWEDKPEEIEERLRDELPILTELPERAIHSDDKEAPNHILIEGDNLEALTALAYTHEGKIDVIYIDPPYNTGKKDDFIYNDSYVDSEDSFRHSKWLSFMHKRLQIAKQLLSDKGVIFISIDDNEQAQLKLLCDGIFLKHNFITCFCVIRAEGGGLAKQVVKGHDYCLVYAKNIGNFKPLARPKDIRGKIVKKNGIDYWIQEDWLRKEFGKYGNCHYEEIVKYKGEGLKKEVDLEIKNGNYVLVPKPNGMNIVGRLKRVDEDSSKFYSVLKHLNKNGVNELISIGINFDYPKPLSLILELIRGASFFYKNAIILDFFAGSGTTLHATMQLNAEDGGHRRCILVTNNENNICEEVTYERNKRVIQGYVNAKGEDVPGLTRNNLRYYRTGFVDRSRSMQNMRRLTTLATDMLCIKEDIYNEQTALDGHETRREEFRYFDNGEREMLVIYREEAIDEVADILCTMEVPRPIKVYVFSPGEDPWEGSFVKVREKVELCALPQAIYNAYRRILPKERDVVIDQEEDIR